MSPAFSCSLVGVNFPRFQLKLNEKSQNHRLGEILKSYLWEMILPRSEKLEKTLF